MAKPKKEFKARVRKMQKHVKALIEISATDWQRQMIYRMQGDLDELTAKLDEQFDEEPRDGTLRDLGARKEPIAIRPE